MTDHQDQSEIIDEAETGKKKRKGPSRRLLILGGLAAGGGLAIGAALSPFSRIEEQRRMLAKSGENVLLSSLRIAPDNTITVIYPHADMGTGNGTALAQILADELDANWDDIRIERAPGETAFANGPLGQAYLRGEMEIPAPLAGLSWLITRRLAENMHLQMTGGSMAISMTGMEGMRHAGASARYMLARAAAKAWGVSHREIEFANGMMSHASGKSATFGEFAEASLEYDPPARLPFKSKPAYTQIGKSRPRFDIPPKVTGKAIYSGDVRMPGMVYAAMRICPVPGGTLESVDGAVVSGRRGVAQVATLPNAVAVFADNFWRAREAVRALDPVWSPGDNAGLDSQATLAAMETATTSGNLKKDHARGGAKRVFDDAGERTIERVYKVPFLAHAAMETLGCVVWAKDGELEIWGAFQDALLAKFTAASAADISANKVTVHHTEMGGAFGRRGYTIDFLEYAVGLAKQTDKPVNLIYTREEDMTQDFYRNASVARMRAVLGEDGLPEAIAHYYAERHDPKDASFFPYDVANMDVRFANGHNTAPWGAWRSVDHSVQGFFIESFIDELAHEAGQDPYQYRRALLAHDPRMLAVLDAVADMSGWSSYNGAPGRALGMAIKKSFGTVVAEVAEVEIADNGGLRVHNVWVAADPGLVVNPDGFTQQMESGVIYGLTAALYGEISYENGQVVQQNFWDYPMVKMADCPRIEVKILESGAKTGGAGEPGTPPIAAAVANAAFVATGKRLRQLPLSPPGVSLGA